MPGTTPVYGFPYPEPTDLVADYPALGQQLAEDIEDVLPTIGGMALITSQAYTSAASVSVNNCFTSTYVNYWVTVEGTNSSTGYINLRMRVSGTDATTNYNYSTLASGTSTPGSTRTTNGSSIDVSYGIASESYGNGFWVYGPQLAVPTKIATMYPYNATSVSWQQSIGYHNAATAYDGFTLLPAAGNTTGTVRVYGLRNS